VVKILGALERRWDPFWITSVIWCTAMVRKESWSFAETYGPPFHVMPRSKGG